MKKKQKKGLFPFTRQVLKEQGLTFVKLGQHDSINKLIYYVF